MRFAGSSSGTGHRVERLEAEGAAIRIARGITIGRAVLRLRVLPQSGAPAWVDVNAGGSLEGARLSLDTLSLRSPESLVAGRGAISLPSGSGRQRHDLRVLGIHLTARPLAWNDLRLLKPELDRPGTVSLSLDGRREANGAAVHLIAESSDGGARRSGASCLLQALPRSRIEEMSGCDGWIRACSGSIPAAETG